MVAMADQVERASWEIIQVGAVAAVAQAAARPMLAAAALAAAMAAVAAVAVAAPMASILAQAAQGVMVLWSSSHITKHLALHSMSDATLSKLVASAIAANLAPVVRWLYATFATVILGTAFVVGMVYDVKQGIKDAAKDAEKANTSISVLAPTVSTHASKIAVIEALLGQKGGG